MSAGRRILVVEDEAVLRTGLCDALAMHGLVPESAAGGDTGLQKALQETYALVVLDVMLPEMNGFDVCRSLRRQRPAQAILLLTARGSEDDILEGFRCGADDYMTKPFSLAQLLARVDALLRRSSMTCSSSSLPFAFGPWEIEPATRQATRGERILLLTAREIDLLGLLARERGRIVGRRQLLIEVWGMQHVDDIETRTVDMHIAKLRKKIDGAGELIETIRGEGYRYAG